MYTVQATALVYAVVIRQTKMRVKQKKLRNNHHIHTYSTTQVYYTYKRYTPRFINILYPGQYHRSQSRLRRGQWDIFEYNVM